MPERRHCHLRALAGARRCPRMGRIWHVPGHRPPTARTYSDTAARLYAGEAPQVRGGGQADDEVQRCRLDLPGSDDSTAAKSLMMLPKANLMVLATVAG
jgi:hypothetical protein